MQETMATISQVGERFSATGTSLVVHEWRGSGPGYMHVHDHDDECWHVLEGSLVFRFLEGEVTAPAGTTIFVPAGMAHDYSAGSETSRYLIILTPNLDALIQELHKTSFALHAGVHEKYGSRVLS